MYFKEKPYYREAIEMGFSDKQASALKFLEVIEDKKELAFWLNKIFTAVKQYCDDVDSWGETKKYQSDFIKENEAKRISKIATAKKLLELMLQGEGGFSLSYAGNDKLQNLITELKVNIFRWETQDYRRDTRHFGSQDDEQIFRIQPNKREIENIIDEIHINYNIKNAKENKPHFTKTI